MAIVFTSTGVAVASTSNTSSYAGTAFTPTTGDLLLFFVSATGSSAAGTVSGTWTWSLLNFFTYNAGADLMAVYWATATAGTSTTPTYNTSGGNASGCCVHCIKVTGAEGQAQPYVRQMKSNTASTANPSVTLDRAVLTGNGVIGFGANGTNSAAQWTPPSTGGGWTESQEVAHLSPTHSMETAFRASGETSTTITWTNANTTAWGLFVMELYVAGGTTSENTAIIGSSGGGGFFGLNNTP